MGHERERRTPVGRRLGWRLQLAVFTMLGVVLAACSNPVEQASQLRERPQGADNALPTPLERAAVGDEEDEAEEPPEDQTQEAQQQVEQPPEDQTQEPQQQVEQPPEDQVEQPQQPEERPSAQDPPQERPGSNGFPDASTTGVPEGTSLEPSSSVTITEDGAVIDALDVSGTITVQANDVTIKRTRVRTDGAVYGIKVESGTSGTLIEDTEIAGTDAHCSIGIVYGRYTARRVQVHGCEDGFRVGSDIRIEDSYSHSQRPGPGTHNDALQSTGGSNVKIVGNTLEGRFREQTSAIIMQSNFAPIDNVLIEGNKLSGGTFTLYVRDKDDGHGPPTNVVVRDNVFVEDSMKFGPHSLDRGRGFVWEGNVDERGQPVH